MTSAPEETAAAAGACAFAAFRNGKPEKARGAQGKGHQTAAQREAPRHRQDWNLVRVCGELRAQRTPEGLEHSFGIAARPQNPSAPAAPAANPPKKGTPAYAAVTCKKETK
jgi:hypothetical protein